ncbi:MAG: hypothetical protein JJE17_10580 [Peptostreptococcaceae bacterium]|nr:hypothetical protein [Peptostreptococcaceae bacterium]
MRKEKFRQGLTKLLPLIPYYPEWISTGELAKLLGITTMRTISWIKGIPEEIPIALDDISGGGNKYCYIKDKKGNYLI